jgi:SPP1 gp7 family putative phage head morphogenesis protein|tara:strand:- start:49 stop:1044 length:996 start_codon:yes stop_codon:yes gene_type:complete
MNKIVKAFGNSGHVILPKEDVGKRVNLSFEDLKRVQMEMQDIIEEDMLNPPDLPHVREMVRDAFKLFREDPQKAEKMLIKKINGVFEAKPYADFLKAEFTKWEKQVLSFVDETLDAEFINKSFSDFMRRVFNVVNTAGFRTKLQASIKTIFKGGIEEAEVEMNVDVGFDLDFENDVDVETTRQLDGFYIDGKPWAGLKGVAEDVQKELREMVVKGIESKQSLKELKTDIKNKMEKLTGDEVSEGRAMKIARTESNRMRNAAKQRSFEKSGLVGQKRWNAFHDGRTSEVCKRLNNQVIPLDKSFIDVPSGKEFPFPPAHPNCRSVIEFVLPD